MNEKKRRAHCMTFYCIIFHPRIEVQKEEKCHLLENLFPFCLERDFIMFLSEDKQAEIIESFN